MNASLTFERIQHGFSHQWPISGGVRLEEIVRLRISSHCGVRVQWFSVPAVGGGCEQRGKESMSGGWLIFVWIQGMKEGCSFSQGDICLDICEMSMKRPASQSRDAKRMTRGAEWGKVCILLWISSPTTMSKSNYKLLMTVDTTTKIYT